jgi:hypothetical protein
MCFFCGAVLPEGRIGFRDLCAACGKELHVCRNCKFFKPGVYRDCAETVPEAVRDKERLNFCEYFRPNMNLQGGEAAAKASAAKKSFDNLFGS